VRHRGAVNTDEAPKDSRLGLAVLLTAVGFAGLIGGGRVTVNAAIEVARTVGLSEAVIGMTVVAVGTSLPELVTSVVSVVRGQSDLAIGNVVGSNIFNLLFVLGVTATIADVPVPAGGRADLLIVAGLSAALLPLSLNTVRAVPRLGGLLLLVGYAGYLVWRTLGG
jgi:cation:H+ antiporter